jgi:hypothetical protein
MVPQGVAAYVESAEALRDQPSWCVPSARFKRAIEIGSRLRGAHASHQTAVSAVERTIDRVGTGDTQFLVHRLMQLLLAVGAGKPAQMAALAGDIAARAREHYEMNGVGLGLECARERDYLEVQLAWLKKAGDPVAAQRVALEIADAFVRQADAVIAARWPMHNAVAARFVNDAIEQVRGVGNQGTKLAELRHRMEQLQRAAIDALPRTPLDIDLTSVQSDARAHVSGKPIMSALLSLSFGYGPPSFDELVASVQASSGVNLMSSLPSLYVGPRGTTQATHEGLTTDDDALQVEVMRKSSERQQLVAATFVAPAIEQIMNEHNLETAFFAGLAARSGFVPARRERSYGLGLAAGARGDFDLAATLLFPQFEHAVREAFHGNKIVTTTLPDSGIQNEHDLNILLRHEAMPQLFGEKQSFDLRVLLIEKAGSNLRNDLSHGILDDGAKRGAKAYFWWICLRFALNYRVEVMPLTAAQSMD